MWTTLLNLWIFYVILAVLLWVVNALLPLPKALKGLGVLLILTYGLFYTVQYLGLASFGIPVWHYI